VILYSWLDLEKKKIVDLVLLKYMEGLKQKIKKIDQYVKIHASGGEKKCIFGKYGFYFI